jgi:hypothetical protein
MSDKSTIWQIVNALLIAIIVLALVGTASWFVQRADDALGHGPLPSGLAPTNAYVLTLVTAVLGLLTGGAVAIGMRQVKFITREFAWIVYVLVALPLLALLFTPLQRFGHEAFAGLPSWLVGMSARTVIAVALGSVLIGAIDLRRVLPGMVQESARALPRVDGTAMRGLPGRFTPNAWRALSFMQEEAQRFGHTYIGTEHLLLGLLRDARSQASRVLVTLGAEPSSLKGQLEGVIGRRGSLYTGATGMTRRCQRVIESSARIARSGGERLVSTGHLLQAMAEQPEDVAGQMLETASITADKVGTELRHLGPEVE